MDQMSSVSLNGKGDARADTLRPADPVFVLCMGRTGSTLLRLILDSHPDLACPPETNIPALCAQLAVVWSLIDGAPLSPQRGDAPPEIPEAAIAGIRQTMDLMTAPYLGRRGKRLLCDKSLSTARFAELLIRIYPGTRFICLFRHPMDMISSGIEACPWGLNGYGFDQYIAGSPGNAVLALARYWHDEAHAIAEVEDKYPDRCHRVRYEDMAQEPERVAAGVFSFIGVRPAPGISDAVFSDEHERFGPADHKIWHTSRISRESIGRSDAVPAGLIPPPVLDGINELLDKLGYARVDDTWGTADMPAGVLAPAPASPPAAGSAAEPQPPADAMLVADRLAAGLSRIDGDFAARWPACMAETFTVAVRQPGSGASARWHVDLRARTLISEDQLDNGSEENGTAPDWSIVGTAQTWNAVLSGQLNLSVALRRCDLRYCDLGENDLLASDARITMLATFLGLPSWKRGRDASPASPASPAAAAAPAARLPVTADAR
jgi:hypothetical protein